MIFSWNNVITTFQVFRIYFFQVKNISWRFIFQYCICLCALTTHNKYLCTYVCKLLKIMASFHMNFYGLQISHANLELKTRRNILPGRELTRNANSHVRRRSLYFREISTICACIFYSCSQFLERGKERMVRAINLRADRTRYKWFKIQTISGSFRFRVWRPPSR